MKIRRLIQLTMAAALTCSVLFASPIQEPTPLPDPDATAPGMNSCTSTKGCLNCAIDVSTGKTICALLQWQNGYCKCTTGTTCVASGSCKYVGG